MPSRCDYYPDRERTIIEQIQDMEREKAHLREENKNLKRIVEELKEENKKLNDVIETIRIKKWIF